MKRLSLLRIRLNVEILIFDSLSGKILRKEKGHNLVVTDGRNLIRDFLFGDAVGGLTQMAFGTSSTAVTATDTALGAQVFADTLTNKIKSPGSLLTSYFLATGSANGNTLREAGLKNAAGVLFARYVFATPIVKTSSIAVTFNWTINISAS